ncbi:MAG: serine/threonine protein kinase [Proteobacteria bacterium]|nr:serine/threonine protein kinase [Pseudomonadota bacterium]
MTDQRSQLSSGGASYDRAASRMRFVAPPGMSMKPGGGVKKIGRYEVIKMLGKGAMGVVYKARDPFLDRVVAVKTIVSPKSGGKRTRAAYIERFQREAKAAAKMQHPSIVTIFDVGVDDGAPFMVLEYLPGESLADRLDRVRIPLGKGIQIGLDLANALAFAHRQRIVHRDVKPANVLHAGENRWKLADFGIARLPDSDLTQVGIFMGTPGYSPPEAIRLGRYTPQADVFAWGAVLYEILSGHIPYEGPDTKTTNSYVLKDTAPSLRDYDRSIPQPLADVVMTALDSSAETRYKNGADAEEALRRAWESCLNDNLIPPSCLTGEEIPHERVGPEMHIPRGNDARTPPSMARGVPHMAEHSLRREQDGSQPVLVIESREGDISDEAPTQVLIRDSIAGPGERKQSPPGFSTTTGLPFDPEGATGEHLVKERGVGARRSSLLRRVPPSYQPDHTAELSRRTEPMRWLWVAVVVAALAGGAALAYLLAA